MLRITIKGDDFFDEEKNEFISIGDVILDLEHSLVSLSKWEAKYEKAFLGRSEKTNEELFDYLRCMIVNEDFDPTVMQRASKENFEEIQKYIESNQSAVKFDAMPGKSGTGETITSELIYYWMVAYNIPFECEVWHLNRLFALIRICNVKNAPKKKMSKQEIARQNRELNAKRKAELGTKG